MSKFIPNSFQVPNVLVDEYITKLSSHSFKLLMFIIRKTKGFQKQKDTISTTQLAKVLGIKKLSNIYPYVKELESLNLIKTHKSLGKTNQFSLGKNFTKPVPKKATTESESSPKKGEYPVPNTGTTTSPKKGDSTKDNIKTNINKEKNKQKENLIDCFSDDEKPLVQILIDHRQEIKAPLKTERATRMLIKELNHYAQEWEINLDDTLDYWLSKRWQSIDVSYDYPFRSRDKSKDNQPNKGTVDGMSDVKKARIQMRINENKIRIAS